MPFNLITDLDSQPGASIHDRGLHYGDGLFETMLLRAGKIRHWQAHYQRLNASARRLHIDCPKRDWLEENLRPFFCLNQDLVIKIILTRGSEGRALDIPAKQKPNVYLLHYPYAVSPKNQCISAFFSSITLSENSKLAGIKHLNRLDYVMAAHELGENPNFNEAILCDQQGHVIEGIIHNLFFIVDGRILTPDLTRCGVEGIARAIILKHIQRDGLKINIGRFTKEQLGEASECFMCNSVQGIRPVVQIENKALEIGPRTRQLQQSLNATATD